MDIHLFEGRTNECLGFFIGKHVHLDNVRYTGFRLHVQTVTQINSHVYNIGKLSHSIM